MTIPYPEEKVLQDQLSMLNPDEIKAANKTIKKINEEFPPLRRRGHPSTNSLYQLIPEEMDDILIFD